jgi:hypothetical protein
MLSSNSANETPILTNAHPAVETVLLTVAADTSYLSASIQKKRDRIKIRQLQSLCYTEPIRLMHRDELPVKKVTRDHIVSLLGTSILLNSNSDDLIAEKLKWVKSLKSDARAFAGMHIRHRMLEVGVQKGMKINGRVINCSQELLKSWKTEAPSAGQCEIIFMITYGWFDSNRSWNHDLESEFMQSRCIMYLNEAADDWQRLESNLKMGCIARLFAEVKNDVVPQIRKVGVSSHGVKVSISLHLSCDCCSKK